MEEAYQNLSICSERSCRSANNLITDVAHAHYKKASSTESTKKRPAYSKRCPLDLPGFKNAYRPNNARSRERRNDTGLFWGYRKAGYDAISEKPTADISSGLSRFSWTVPNSS